jgi:RNA polymerase sigma factor (sigma-70 family)
MDQHELVAKARRGDGAAFAALVEPELASMVRLAAVVSGNAGDAEDIVQESMTRVLRSLRSFDASRPFRPWFATIVANQARNAKRSRGRRRRLTLRIATIADVGVASVEDHAVLTDDSTALMQLLSQLDLPDREVLALRFLSDLSETETATALGIPVGTVKSRSSRALSRLREKVSSTSLVSERMESRVD